MKKFFVKDLLRADPGSQVVVLGWVMNKRSQKKDVFLDVCDSTGFIQVVVPCSAQVEPVGTAISGIPTEAAVMVKGTLVPSRIGIEVRADSIRLIGDATRRFVPQPRSAIDIFDERFTKTLLKHRHMYLRNPRVMEILRFRDQLLHHVRDWFRRNEYIAIEAPILTPVPLYADQTAMPIRVNKDEDVFLTQCVGYYLEAAVHAFERVYNIGPSFRGEESRSKRHLMEYWHIKAEVAWMDLDGIILMVEDILSSVTAACEPDLRRADAVLGRRGSRDGLKTPFPRITYDESLVRLRAAGMKADYGINLGSEEEAELSKLFDRPFWITGIPRVLEPFPYVIDGNDQRVTRVADLIASNGYGELLGVAEKISERAMLDERMREKGKDADRRYDFVRDVHDVGCVPHAAFGMGVERLIRWMLNIPHVRDAIPFPRVFRRKISP